MRPLQHRLCPAVAEGPLRVESTPGGGQERQHSPNLEAALLLGSSGVPNCPTVPVPMATSLSLVSSLYPEKSKIQLLAGYPFGRQALEGYDSRPPEPACPPGSRRPREVKQARVGAVATGFPWARRAKGEGLPPGSPPSCLRLEAAHGQPVGRQRQAGGDSRQTSCSGVPAVLLRGLCVVPEASPSPTLWLRRTVEVLLRRAARAITQNETCKQRLCKFRIGEGGRRWEQ